MGVHGYEPPEPSQRTIIRREGGVAIGGTLSSAFSLELRVSIHEVALAAEERQHSNARFLEHHPASSRRGLATM